MKITKITKGEKTESSNNRPSSILPAKAKIFEKILFGFRDQRRTVDVLVEVSENLRSNWINNTVGLDALSLTLKTPSFNTIDNILKPLNITTEELREI